MAQTAKPPAPSPCGLADVVAASTAISDIDGERGQQVVALRDR